jgi:RsiW-degrading membrane proteinase PrsW (M82 family)
MDWIAGVAGEAEQKYRRAALVLRTLAWISIVWAAAVSIWIWMGAKAGSNLWLWIVIGLFLIGAVLLLIASRLQVRAARVIERPIAHHDPKLHDGPKLPDDNGIKAA